MSTAVIWSKSKPGVEFQYGGRLGEFNGMSSQSHISHCRVLPLDEFNLMIPEPHATLQGAVTWRNQCHDHATLQGVRIPSRHIAHCCSPYFFVFNAVWVLTSSGFCIVSDTLVIVIVQFHVLGQHGSDWSGDLATSTLTYRSEELTAGGDAVPDTDSRCNVM